MDTKNIPIMQDADIETKEIPQNFDHQILLYAKNWYKRSGDVVKDLGELLQAYTGNPDSTIGLVRECLANCWADYCPDHLKGRATQEMLGWGWVNPTLNRTPEQVMISTLGVCSGKYVDPTELLPVLVKDKKEEVGS